MCKVIGMDKVPSNDEDKTNNVPVNRLKLCESIEHCIYNNIWMYLNYFWIVHVVLKIYHTFFIIEFFYSV